MCSYFSFKLIFIKLHFLPILARTYFQSSEERNSFLLIQQKTLECFYDMNIINNFNKYYMQKDIMLAWQHSTLYWVLQCSKLKQFMIQIIWNAEDTKMASLMGSRTKKQSFFSAPPLRGGGWRGKACPLGKNNFCLSSKKSHINPPKSFGQ